MMQQVPLSLKRLASDIDAFMEALDPAEWKATTFYLILYLLLCNGYHEF